MGGTKNAVMMIIGIIFMAVAFTVFPTLLAGANSLRNAIAASSHNYTGLASVVLIAPTLIFLGLLFGGLGSFGLGLKGVVGK